MKVNRTARLHRILCAALALVMALTCVPWIGGAKAADATKTIYSQNFDDLEDGFVDDRLGGWDVIANGEDSVVEIVDSEDAEHGKVIKITQPGDGVNDIVLDYVLPGTTGYTDAVLSFDIRVSANARLNNVGLRGGTYNNPRAFISVKEGKFWEGTSSEEISAYTADTWYHVEIRAYKDGTDGNQYYDILINDAQVATKVTPYDNAALKGIVIQVSMWNAATVMVDNVVAFQPLAAPYTDLESFADQTENAEIGTCTGWTTRISGTNATTATIANVGTQEAPDYALKLTAMASDYNARHFWTHYSLGGARSDVELTFDFMAGQNVTAQFIGLYGSNAETERAAVKLTGSKVLALYSKNNDFQEIADYTPGSWYTVKLVYRKNPVNSAYTYDVYFAPKGETPVLKVSNLSTKNGSDVSHFGVHLNKGTRPGDLFLDNISVVQLPARLAADTFENLPVGKVDVLEGWINKTIAKAAVASVKTTEDVQHGKVLYLYQTGKETADSHEIRLQYDLPDNYSELTVSYDILASRSDIYLNGIYLRNGGTYSSSFGAKDGYFQVTESGGSNNAKTDVAVAANTWYHVTMYYYAEADAEGVNQYYLDVSINDTKVAQKWDARQDIPINSLFVELSRLVEGYIYLDNLVISTMAPAEIPESDGSDAVQYAGMDKTTGNKWIGVYGAKQAILPAKNVADAPNFESYDTSSGGVAMYRQVVKDGNDFYSDTSENAIKVSYNTGGGWWCLPAATHGLDLETPQGAGQYASLLNAYCMAGYTVNNDQQTTFKFTVPDGKLHQLTVFGSNPTKETGKVRFVFLDADGNQTGSTTFNYSDFNGGAYVSFLVEGSFTLRIDKINAGGASKARYFGMGAFFFDEVSANFTSGLEAELGTEARSIDVTWAETNAPEGSKIIIFRKSASKGYAQIATVDAGVKAYHDSNLKSGETYAYKLCCVTGNAYSSYSEEVACTVADYTQGIVTLDRADYTVADATQDVTVLATVKDAEDNPYEGVDVSLTVRWAFDAEDTQTYTAQTNAEGVATITFRPEYMGSAVLTVESADHDGHKLGGDTKTAPLFVGQKNWTEAPVIYRVSEGVAPGQTLGIYGYGMYESGSDADVNVNNVTIYYAPHTAAVAPDAPPAAAAMLEVLQSDNENGTYLMAELPEEAQGGLYDIWVKNAYGYSTPVVLNAARPLFISEYEAWAGQTIQVSGRNLDATQFGASRNTQLRLVPVGGGEAVAQTLTKLTPYSMAFTVSGAEGEYYVEVSNDGLTWVRPHSGQTLTIVAAGNDFFGLGLAWMDSFQWNTVINVTAHGANGGDEVSDKAAFEAAVAAAKAAGGGVVYIPNGTYYLDQLLIPSHVVLVGESMKKTVIVYNGDGAKVNFFQGDAATRNEGYLGFARFTVRLADETKRPDAFFWLGHAWEDSEHKYAYDQRTRTADNFFLYQIYLDSADTKPVAASRGLGIVAVGDERMVIQDCLFEGYSVGMGSNKVSRYVTLKDNEWYLEDGNVSISANYSFVEGNYVKGRYTEISDEEVTGDTHGLCFSAWCHLEDNFVEKMGSKSNLEAPSGEFNDGETYLPECQEHFETGFVVNATENSVTVRAADGTFNEIQAGSRAWSRNRLCVVILAGRGAGQLKTIGSMNYATGVITLADGETWDVMPDSTSVFSINLPLECNTLYNNKEATSAKGLYFYQDTVDCVIANHTCEDTLGISIFAPTVNANRVKLASYITVRDCLVKGHSARAQAGHISINAGREYVNTYYGTNSFGVEIRDNTILGTRGLVGRPNTEASAASGIVLRTGASHMPTDSEDGDITAVIVEGNTLSNLDAGVTYTVQTYGLLVKDNSFYNCGEQTMQWYAYQDDDALIKHMQVINSTVNNAPIIASVNGERMFTSLAEALKAAGADEIVLLMADQEINTLVLMANQALDLNGHELTADYVVAFADGKVMDSTGKGLLKCAKVSLAADNGQMPVWDADASGYRLFAVLDYQKLFDQKDNGFSFSTKPALGAFANDKYFAADANQLTMKARISWTTDSGNDVEQMFTVKAADLKTAYTDDDMEIQLKVTGTGALKDKLWVTTWIESETGVIWTGADLKYTG